MVDPIQSANVSRLRPADPAAKGVGDAQARVPSTQPVGSTDEIALSDTATNVMISRMSEEGPPFDSARVDRIKTAIAEGSYPVDAQRVADSFFQDFEALLG